MILNQANLFLIFTINGILIGLLFDIFRILRKSFKTTDFVTYIEDIAFWILTGIIILYSIFVFNNGEIRLFMFIGILIGIGFYILIFSKYFIKINVLIIKWIKKIINVIYNIIKIPFKFIFSIISKPIKIFVINIRKIIRQIYTKIIKNNIKNVKKHKNIKKIHKIEEKKGEKV